MLSTVLEFWSDLVISFLYGLGRFFVCSKEVRCFELSHVCAPNCADAKQNLDFSSVFITSMIVYILWQMVHGR